MWFQITGTYAEVVDQLVHGIGMEPSKKVNDTNARMREKMLRFLEYYPNVLQYTYIVLFLQLRTYHLVGSGGWPGTRWLIVSTHHVYRQHNTYAKLIPTNRISAHPFNKVCLE